MGDNYKTYGLDDVLSSIKKAKENDNIKGIYICLLYTSVLFLPQLWKERNTGVVRKKHICSERTDNKPAKGYIRKARILNENY